MLFLGSSLSHAASPPSTGEAWLQAIDKANSPFEDTQLQMEVTVEKANKKSVQRTLEVWQRGQKERLVVLKKPARLAGVALLVVEDGSIYSYLPAYRRSRRVVGEQRGDAFMGTDFSMEDLSRMGFSEEFDATIIRSGATSTELLLQAKNPEAHRFPALKIWADHQNLLPLRIEHIDAEGVVRRRLSLNDIKTIDNQPFAHRIELEDLERDRKCTAVVKKIQVNQNLGSHLFLASNLGR